MAITKLSPSEVDARLRELDGWNLVRGKLHRELTFPDFKEAFAFMTKAARISEKMDHHPDWSNVYNKVVLDLCTHECQGISERDFRWAEAVTRVLQAGQSR